LSGKQKYENEWNTLKEEEKIESIQILGIR